MNPVKPPAKAADEDKALTRLCKAPAWAAHHATWKSAYDAYRKAKGDPWRITPAVFSTDPAEVARIAAEQKDFYTKRSGGGPLARIRRTPGLTCCPMCGSHHPGTLDHYLPRQAFPEFSILSCNLIPACPYCNSGVKKARYRGAVAGERFLHPYFDTLAKDEIWHVEVLAPFEAARFMPRVAAGVPATLTPMVQFHLDHILGEVFADYVATQWSRLPALIHRCAVAGEPITVSVATSQLERQLTAAAVTGGINGWQTAFLRGVTMDRRAIAFLAAQAVLVGTLTR